MIEEVLYSCEGQFGDNEGSEDGYENELWENVEEEYERENPNPWGGEEELNDEDEDEDF